MTTKKNGTKVPQAKKGAVSNAAPNATALRKVEDKQKAAEAKKPEPGKTAESVGAIAAARVERLERMQRLADRHKHLKEKDAELERFQSASDGTNGRLVLSNGSGTFEVTNSEVIAETVAHVRRLLDGRLQEAEKELVEFEV